MKTSILKELPLLSTILMLALLTGVSVASYADTSRYEGASVHDEMEGKQEEVGEGHEGEEAPVAEGEDTQEGEPPGDEVPVEGEEPPFEGEPPIDSDPPGDPGRLVGVSLIAPRGDIVVSSNAEMVSFLLAAKADVDDGDLDPDRIAVLFAIDDLPYQAGWHEGGFFFLNVKAPAASFFEEQAEGEAAGNGSEGPEAELEVHVIAYDMQDESAYFASPAYMIRLRTAYDLSQNGFVDNPFLALSAPGDQWQALVAGDECPKAVVMTSITPGDGYTPLFIQNPTYPEQITSVWAPNALVEPEEYGIVIVATACSPDALYWPYETSTMYASEPGRLTQDGAYTDISVVVSRDQGRTFEDVTPLRLAAHPIRIQFGRLTERDGYQTVFHGFPTLVDSDTITGIRLVPLNGQWSRDGVVDYGKPYPGGVHSVDLHRLYALAPFDLIHPAELSVEPQPTSPYNYGAVRVNDPKTATFTLTNIGGEMLQCRLELDDKDGVFFLQGVNEMLIEPGDKREVRVQFNPGDARSYEATLSFYGGENSPQRLTLLGRGIPKEKSIQPLGCGPTDARRGIDVGAWLLGALVVALLYWRDRRDAAARVSGTRTN